MNNRTLPICLGLLVCFLLLLISCMPDTEYDEQLQRDTQSNASRAADLFQTYPPETPDISQSIEVIVNVKSGMYHTDPYCAHAMKISDNNKCTLIATPQELYGMGYTPCSACSSLYRLFFDLPDSAVQTDEPDSASVTDTLSETELGARNIIDTAPNPPETSPGETEIRLCIILNTKTKVFHYKDDCRYVKRMKAENKKYVNELTATLLAEGYRPCSACAAGIGSTGN